MLAPGHADRCLLRVYEMLESTMETRVRPPSLTSRHIQHLRVVKNRSRVLMLMPSKGIVAEVGVDEGNFSKEIP